MYALILLASFTMPPVGLPEMFGPMPNFDGGDAVLKLATDDECGEDVECVRARDGQAFALAWTRKDVSFCRFSSRPGSCAESVHLILDDLLVLTQAEKVLHDPCSFSVRVEGIWTVLYSQRWHVSMWAKTLPGWEPLSYIGDCRAINTVAAGSLPGFPWSFGNSRRAED